MKSKPYLGGHPRGSRDKDEKIMSETLPTFVWVRGEIVFSVRQLKVSPG